MLTIDAGGTGRGKNTAWWAGIANLFWWCDREKGVAGMIASQVMPFGDMNVLGESNKKALDVVVYGEMLTSLSCPGQWITNETEVYNALK